MKTLLGMVLTLALALSSCGEVPAKKTDNTGAVDPGWAAPDNGLGGQGAPGEQSRPGTQGVANSEPGETPVVDSPTPTEVPVETTVEVETDRPDNNEPGDVETPVVDRELIEKQCRDFAKEVCKQIDRCNEESTDVDDCIAGFGEIACSEEGYWTCRDGKRYVPAAAQRCIDNIRDIECEEFGSSEDPCADRCR